MLCNKLPHIQLKLAFQLGKADVYCCGEIDLILHLSYPVLFDDYGVCNSGTEVIHQQSCKYLLLYRCFPFGMEVHQAYRVFKKSERSLNAPPEMVQFLQLFRREFIRVERCTDYLIISIVKLKLYKT